MTVRRWCSAILLGLLVASLPREVALAPTQAPRLFTTTESNALSVVDLKPRPKVASPSISSGVIGDVWWELAHCENDKSDDSAPYNADGDRYHGWFQFTLQTWRSIGGTGDPHTYSYAYQRDMAIKLWKKVGRTWRTQWPGCSRKLKLP